MSFGGVSSPAQISLRRPLPHGGRFHHAHLQRQPHQGLAQSHLFKAGFIIQHALYNQYHQAGGNSFPGSFAFGTDANNPIDSGYAYANAFLGNYDTYNEATNRVDYAPITRIWEWYVQDTWKSRRRLTLDIGVRFTGACRRRPPTTTPPISFPRCSIPAQAPVLYTPAKVNGQNVTINPITGAVVPTSTPV